MAKTKVIISIISITVVLILGFASFFLSGDISEWITGKTTTSRAFILESHPINCSVNLTQGLNLVSFPCETAQDPLYVALSNQNNETLKFNYIFVFNPLHAKDPWGSYKPSLPNWTIQEEILNLDRRRGYFIYMEEEGTYYAEGLRVPISNMQLRKGWNLVGYPTTNIKSVEDALQTIQQQYVSVHAYQTINDSKEWLHHIKNEGGTLTHFKPGYGYWIFVEEDVIWRLDW